MTPTPETMHDTKLDYGEPWIVELRDISLYQPTEIRVRDNCRSKHNDVAATARDSDFALRIAACINALEGLTYRELERLQLVESDCIRALVSSRPKSTRSPTPETHVFIGMFRPPWREFLASKQSALEDHLEIARRIEADKASEPFNFFDPLKPEFMYKYEWEQGLENSWLRGDYDTPVYKTHEEVVKMKAVIVPETMDETRERIGETAQHMQSVSQMMKENDRV